MQVELSHEDIPAFNSKLVAIDSFLRGGTFQILLDSVLGVAGKRVHIAGHKRGETVAYEQLCRLAPRVIGFYRSPLLQNCISAIVGEAVYPTPVRDQNSCSILVYGLPNDRIGWHYDHNFYNGRHFTALLSLVNEFVGTTELSSARLLVRKGRNEVVVPTPPNTFVLFEGAYVLHRVTPLANGERRIILSMTYCTDVQTTRLKDLQRRVKDIAYFGLRALWV